MKITTRNWQQFQHYKDRSPPWIRLHRDLLDNYEFQCLPVASRALAPMLWLLASDNMDGVIDANPKKLAFRLRMSESELVDALKPLIDSGFFADASGVLADRVQVAVPETETETETETEAETEDAGAPPAGRSRRSPVARPDGVTPEVWRDWLTLRRTQKAPVTETVLRTFGREAEKAGITLQAAIETCCQRNWRGFQADWLRQEVKGSRHTKPTMGDAIRRSDELTRDWVPSEFRA